jgi:hypothetical protein
VNRGLRHEDGGRRVGIDSERDLRPAGVPTAREQSPPKRLRAALDDYVTTTIYAAATDFATTGADLLEQTGAKQNVLALS